MQIDVQPFGRLHHQRSLNTRGREWGLRQVIRNSPLHLLPHLTKSRLGVFVLLRVVIARNPPRRVVARHGKLGAFVLHLEVVQLTFLRELVAKAHSIVVNAKADVEHSLGRLLFEPHQQFVIVVSYCAVLAPNGRPSLVGRAFFFAHKRKTVQQVAALYQFKA